jgi:glutamate 5-kinase
VDDGARKALVEHNRSLLPAGIVEVQGTFDADEAVEVADPEGQVFAKGLVKVGSAVLSAAAGKHTDALPEGVPHEVIHRDDLVVLP